MEDPAVRADGDEPSREPEQMCRRPWVPLSACALAVLPLCLVLSGQMGEGRTGVTFNRDVSPLIVRNCTPCHRPGGAGPFPLMSYDDLRKRADQIRRVVMDGDMPPQNAMSEFGMVAWQEPLSDDQRQRIQQWLQAGLPEGSGRPAPIPKFPVWRPSPPQVILSPSATMAVPKEGLPQWRGYVIPYRGEAITVVGFDLVPERPPLVLNARVAIDRDDVANALDAASVDPGYPADSVPSLPISSYLGSWAPGYPNWMFPTRVGVALRTGDDVVVELFTYPSGEKEASRFVLGLHTRSGAAARSPVWFTLKGAPQGSGGSSTVTSSARILTADYDFVGVLPLVRSSTAVKLLARDPRGRTSNLVQIMHLRPENLGAYRLSKRMLLRKGTRLWAEATFLENAEPFRIEVQLAPALAPKE